MAVRIRKTPTQRLKEIAEIIEDVDRRCEVADGPVTSTRREMRDSELCRIYKLAKGRRK